MKFLVHALQALVVHVGVDLRRCNVSVAEQLLDNAQVCPIAQEVGGKGVPQEVGVDADFKARFLSTFLADLPYPDGRETFPANR